MRLSAVTILTLMLGVGLTPGQTAQRIPDPYKAEFFSCDGKPDGRTGNMSRERSPYNGFRIVSDLNFDGREDLIVTKSDRTGGAGCGTSGCGVTIYLMQTDKNYIGVDHWLHPLAAASRMIAPGQGELVTYGRSNASEGSLSFDLVTLDAVKRVRGQVLKFQDFGNNADPNSDEALYGYWFQGSLALNAEYSMCKDGKLEWSRSY